MKYLFNDYNGKNRYESYSGVMYVAYDKEHTDEAVYNEENDKES
jgi:hypothetical protein